MCFVLPGKAWGCSCDSTDSKVGETKINLIGTPFHTASETFVQGMVFHRFNCLIVFKTQTEKGITYSEYSMRCLLFILVVLNTNWL